MASLDLLPAHAEAAREAYIGLFQQALAQMLEDGVAGLTETAVSLEGDALHRSVARVDFLTQPEDPDADPEVVGFLQEPGAVSGPPPYTVMRGETEIRVETLRWEDVEIRHEAPLDPDGPLDRWFRDWFDLDDIAPLADAELLGRIHSLVMREGALYLDLGTAPTEALFELIDLLREEGAEVIEITASRLAQEDGTPDDGDEEDGDL